MAIISTTATATTASPDRFWRGLAWIGLLPMLGAALWLGPRDVSSGDPPNVPFTVESARRELQLRPLESKPLDALAGAALARGSIDEARRLYHLSAERWPRGLTAAPWLVQDALKLGRFSEAFTRLDVLMRAKPQLATEFGKSFRPTLADASVRHLWMQRMQTAPPWAADFGTAVCQPEVPACLLFAAEWHQASPFSREARVVLARALLAQGHAVEAWGEWTALVGHPGLQPGVFDPSFSTLNDGLPGPFGWQMPDTPGVDVVSLDQDLGISFLFNGQPVEFAGFGQTLALPAGSYRLQVSGSGDIRLERPFAWDLVCTGSENVFARIELPLTLHRFDVVKTLEVPTGCVSQRLVLSHEGRTIEERILAGRLILNAVRINRFEARLGAG